MRSEIIFGLSFTLLYAFGIGIIVSVISAWVRSQKLSSYLKKHKISRWRELTGFGGATGMSNTFKSFPYLFGSLDEEDENIAKYRNEIKSRLYCCLLMCVGLVVCLFLSAVTAPPPENQIMNQQDAATERTDFGRDGSGP